MLLFFFSVSELFSTKAQDNLNQKPFVFIVPSFNNKSWHRQNLDSIFKQHYQNYRIIYISDASTDNTGNLVKKYINENGVGNKITLIENDHNQGALANTYKAAHMCDPEEIIVIVDGDDWLYDVHVLEYLNRVYQDPNIWMTYGQFVEWPVGKKARWVHEIPQEVIQANSFRAYPWTSTHLRTFYAGLFHHINKEDLLCEGKFFGSAPDLAAMFPMLEMAGSHSHFIPRTLYVYNTATQLSENKVRLAHQLEMDRLIRSKKKYSPLQSLRREFVIGSWTGGFFSSFFGVINNIIYAEKTHRIPVIYWDKRSLYYDPENNNGLTNAWEYYFEPVSDFDWRKTNIDHTNYVAPDGFSINVNKTLYVDLTLRLFVHEYIAKYIKIKSHLLRKIDLFFDAHLKNKSIIGIHLRGTDKSVFIDGMMPVDPLNILEKANALAEKINEPYEFFVATDDQRLLNLAVQKLRKPPVYYDAKRSKTNNPLHCGVSKVKNPSLLGEEVLIEAVILSRSHFFLHTNSNVANAVCCFNPHIKNFFFDCDKDSRHCTQPSEFNA